jgi:sulfoxide reductase catalytic subunit YedY
MAFLIRPRPWRLPDHAITDEAAWLNRRELVKVLGLGAIAAASPAAIASVPLTQPLQTEFEYILPEYTANNRYPLDRPLTEERVAAMYNNFYEFTADKEDVWRLASSMEVKPWTVEITGAVHKPLTVDLDSLLRKLPHEERSYRFRCVEAWSMTVPWIGFPLHSLVKLARPLGKAKYIRFVTKDAPKMFPGVRSQPWYPWPYYEGLRMDEAMNDLAILATGIYGHPLPNQHGAPLRLVVPWKYGYKSIKSIAKIEFLETRPKTFWNDVVSDEYDFLGNVRPDIPHKRWSQATERVIPTGERVPTLPYNGYSDWVALLYH